MGMIPQIANGVPTDADVKALMDAFDVPAVGASIRYADVSRVIHVAAGSNRFRTVTDRWRKRLLRDHRVLMICRDGQFVAANEDQKSEYSGARQKTGIKAIKVSAVIDREYINAAELSPVNRKEHEHRTLNNATILGVLSQAKRKIAPELPKPTGTLPRHG